MQSQKQADQWTIQKLLSWSVSYFENHKIENPRSNSEILLSFILKIERIDLYLKFDQPLNGEELSAFKKVIKKRVCGEPVAYITGEKGFWNHDFAVSKNVLIPRPDTECLVEKILELLQVEEKNKNILELGTGTGAAIISTASEKPHNNFFASDVSPDALSIARINSETLLKEIGIKFFQGSWFEPFKKIDIKFDIIFSNPPYIPASEIEKLQPEIKNHEPVLALDGGSDGLDCLREIVNEAHRYLVSGGFLLLEMGFDQRESVRDIITESEKYENIIFYNDLGGNNRVVKAQVI